MCDFGIEALHRHRPTGAKTASPLRDMRLSLVSAAPAPCPQMHYGIDFIF